jgi:hypothetical protein
MKVALCAYWTLVDVLLGAGFFLSPVSVYGALAGAASASIGPAGLSRWPSFTSQLNPFRFSGSLTRRPDTIQKTAVVKIRLAGIDGDRLADRFRAHLAFRTDLPNTRVPTQSSRRLTHV